MRSPALLLLVLLPLASAGLPRGADPALADRYKGQQFRCADGTQSFPASYVNDDYCDCEDGSDEPGTAACPNGHFYCVNKGFKGQLISSSRVDDGICDCCDGSDEGGAACANTCNELGARMMEAARQIRKEQAIGYQQRQAYVVDGKAAKERRDADLGTLGAEEEKQRTEMEERERYRNEVEAPAKAAKEIAKAAFDKEEEARKAVEEEEIRVEAENLFRGMDSNRDGETTLEEVQEYSRREDSLLDSEESLALTELSVPDLLETLQNKLRLGREEQAKKEFREKSAARKKKARKPVLKEEKEEKEEEEDELWGEDGQKITREKEIPDPSEYSEEEEWEEEEEEEEEEVSPIRNTIVYDAETQRLIDVFEEAETLYNEAKKRHEHAKRQVEEVQKLNAIDFGPEEEFFSLRGECFEHHDGKYKYTLCPFDQSKQDSTNIGKWEGWEKAGDGKSNYSVMLYTKGASCWQGPNRSTRVEVQCGSQNEIVSASEPAKCEYAYVFKTPAACTKVQDETEIHDEL